MSKIGKKNIIVPKESSIKIEGSSLTITGPKGTKKLTIDDKIFSSKFLDSQFQILPIDKKIDKKISILWGTYRSLVNNAVLGVSKGHEKILELNGVGFRANLKGESLNLQLGFSHDINFDIPENIKIIVEKQTKIKIGVIINDSSGRAWRNGIVGIAIGSSGAKVLSDLRGETDLFGNTLEVTEVGIADEIASAASLLMGQGKEGLPVVLVKGMKESSDMNNAKALIRKASEDLFR